MKSSSVSTAGENDGRRSASAAVHRRGGRPGPRHRTNADVRVDPGRLRGDRADRAAPSNPVRRPRRLRHGSARVASSGRCGAPATARGDDHGQAGRGRGARTQQVLERLQGHRRLLARPGLDGRRRPRQARPSPRHGRQSGRGRPQGSRARAAPRHRPSRDCGARAACERMAHPLAGEHRRPDRPPTHPGRLPHLHRPLRDPGTGIASARPAAARARRGPVRPDGAGRPVGRLGAQPAPDPARGTERSGPPGQDGPQPGDASPAAASGGARDGAAEPPRCRSADRRGQTPAERCSLVGGAGTGSAPGRGAGTVLGRRRPRRGHPHRPASPAAAHHSARMRRGLRPQAGGGLPAADPWGPGAGRAEDPGRAAADRPAVGPLRAA